MTSPLYNFIWRGGNPPANTKPQISTEGLKDLAEGVKAANLLHEEIKRAGVSENPNQHHSPAEEIKGIREVFAEAKKLTEMTEPKPERGKTRYTVLPNGSIVPDPEGEFDKLTDALVAASNLRQGNASTYYYQDPADGEFKAADRPVILHQPSPPEIWMVTPEEGARRLQPGEPVVIKQPPPASGSPPVKSYIIRPDGTVEESEPGKPVVIKIEAAPSSPMPTLPIQPTDAGGKDVGGVIRLPMPQLLEYTKGMQQMRHDSEKHAALMDIMGQLKEEIPRIVSAADRQSKKGGERQIRTSGTSKEIEQKVQESNILKCPHCQTTFTVPKGMTDVLCPNPRCLSNQPPKEE